MRDTYVLSVMAAIFDSPLNPTSEIVHTISAVQADFENAGVAIGSSFLSGIEAEMLLQFVWTSSYGGQLSWRWKVSAIVLRCLCFHGNLAVDVHQKCSFSNFVAILYESWNTSTFSWRPPSRIYPFKLLQSAPVGIGVTHTFTVSCVTSDSDRKTSTWLTAPWWEQEITQKLYNQIWFVHR